jgi:hypothetical protein
MLVSQMKELWIKLSGHQDLIEKFKNAVNDSDYDIIFKEAGCSFRVSNIKDAIGRSGRDFDFTCNIMNSDIIKDMSRGDSLSDEDLDMVSGGMGFDYIKNDIFNMLSRFTKTI